MRYINRIFRILSAILIMVGLFMIVNGSLEAFPTPEQIVREFEILTKRVGDVIFTK